MRVLVRITHLLFHNPGTHKHPSIPKSNPGKQLMGRRSNSWTVIFRILRMKITSIKNEKSPDILVLMLIIL
jgi:hypothetical protein